MNQVRPTINPCSEVAELRIVRLKSCAVFDGSTFGNTPKATLVNIPTSGLSRSYRYHAGIRLLTSEYFQRKGLAVF
jgi:hypothetical protein